MPAGSFLLHSVLIGLLQSAFKSPTFDGWTGTQSPRTHRTLPCLADYDVAATVVWDWLDERGRLDRSFNLSLQQDIGVNTVR
ncbi:hypothetical protein EMIT0111MI5_170041 [Burkholderia sp. IT-111MI5]